MRTTREQVEKFQQLLTGEKFDRTDALGEKVFNKTLEWLRTPGEVTDEERTQVRDLVLQAFSISQVDLTTILAASNGAGHTDVDPKFPKRSARGIETSLWGILPTGGLLREYCEYTEHSEAPLAYHVFCCLVLVGAIVNRRAWYDMSYFKIYPNLGVILIGPSGLKKTSASDIAVNMLQELEITKIYSEKLTPEALIEAMKDMAQGLIYAPELSTFFGKARYLEGIIPLITRFQDCPDKWSSGTIMRKTTFLVDVALSLLMCSTDDWFVKNTPEDMFGGGFFARNLIISQEVSPRIERKPRPGDDKLRHRILLQLAQMHELQGEIIMSPECDVTDNAWYNYHKGSTRPAEHPLIETYYQRKHAHVIRVAICLHLAQHKNFTLCAECYQTSVKLLDWTEQFLGPLIQKMFRSSAGTEMDLVLRMIANEGGIIEWSRLVHRMQYKMRSRDLRAVVESLKDGNQLKEVKDKLQHVVMLKEVV